MARPLRGALIGYGFIGERGHLPAFLSHDGFAITCVADTCEARRELARRAHPGLRVYPDVQSLLAAEAGALDFVDIATPPCDHASVAHAALNHGLHVLCEKPLATTVREAQSMLDHAQRARRVLYPGHNYKHAPVIRAVRDLIAANRIGTVRRVTLSTYRATHAKGVAEWQPDWRRMRRYSGGGIAMDHGSHTFYLAFEWLRSYPLSITAKMSHLAAHDTEDDFTCTLTFPTGVAACQLTWNASMRKVIYTISGDAGAIKVEDDDLEIVGADGAVERLSVASQWGDASHVTWFRTLHDQFAAAIDQGDFVGAEALESFRCVQLIETAYASARSGCREISLPSDVPGAATALR